jgi:hypothetical protein
MKAIFKDRLEAACMPIGGKAEPTGHSYGMSMDSKEMEWATKPWRFWKWRPETTFRSFRSIFGVMGNRLQPMPKVGS